MDLPDRVPDPRREGLHVRLSGLSRGCRPGRARAIWWNIPESRRLPVHGGHPSEAAQDEPHLRRGPVHPPIRLQGGQQQDERGTDRAGHARPRVAPKAPRVTVDREGGFERDYFESCYPDYARQNPPRKLRFYRGLAERAASGIATPRVLDIGCAFGAFLSALDSRWQRFGADVSQYATDEARLKNPDVAFAHADIGHIPFPGPFDIITALDVIEHVPSLELVASVVKSKLAPQGHFIFVVPVYDGPTGPIIRLLDKDETHVHKRSRDFWLGWAEKNFALVEWWGIYRYLVPVAGYWHYPTRVLRRFTPAIVVLA